MPYPTPTERDVSFFAEHGWIAVEDAVDPEDLATLESRCAVILEKKETMAFDWAWEDGTPKDERAFKIVQSSPSLFFPELHDEHFRSWAIDFGSALMNQPLEFWYDQFLAKPPATSAPTRWHQDEGYWGRNLDERGITCWMPMHDVDETNGCMQFIDRGHKDGVIGHQLVPGVQSDLLYCEPDESRRVVCPSAQGWRHVPPQQDSAHDERQHLRRVAASVDPAPARRRQRGRGRPLPVEDLCEPDHRRADHSADPLNRRVLEVEGGTRDDLTGIAHRGRRSRRAMVLGRAPSARSRRQR